MVGRGVEIAAREPERREDVLLHVRFPRIAGDLLHDAREIDEAGVGVAEPRARFEGQFLVRHHRHQLFPRRGLEGLPGLSLRPGPGAALQSTRVREEHPHRDRVHRAVGIVHATQLGDELGHARIEREPAALHELHHRDRRQRFRDRAPVEDRVGVHALAERAVAQSNFMPAHDAPVLDQHGRRAHDRLGRHVTIEGLHIGGPRGHGLLRGEGRAQEHEEREALHGDSSAGVSDNSAPPTRLAASSLRES